jgi:hypothetical protein
MKTKNSLKAEFLEYSRIIAYLKNQLARRIIQEHGWDKPHMIVNIEPGYPRYHVEVDLHSLTMDRQAAVILYKLGIPDALETSGSYRNFNKDYLSISEKSLMDFGRANREKILEWEAQYVPPRPLMERMYKAINGSGEWYDALMGDYTSKLFLSNDYAKTDEDDEPSESFGEPLEAPRGYDGGVA